MQSSEFIRRLLKVILEFFAIVFLISLTVIFIQLNKNTLELIPILSLIAIIVIRFIPSFNTIAAELSYIKVYKLAFQNVSDEIFKERSKNNVNQISSILDKNNAVEVNNLNYQYIDKDKKIPSLQELNMRVKKNSITGIMGKSGAGKSTLINIILGLLTPQSGDVRTIKSNLTDHSFQKVSYVPQDIFLTDESLKNNIAFGFENDEIDLEQINLCLKDAGLSQFVNSSNKGVDMQIGDKGIKLSGGERQRLGIARALYFKPEILILDEATSSLDIETEKSIMITIKELKKKCTIIIIAHRLSTIKDCDNVYLLDKGKVKDQGKLDYLLEKYKSLN